MANATYVSDLERAEHLGYADGAGVKRVSVYNNGTQVNAATEENITDLLFHYKLAGIDDADATYTYLGYLKKDGGWMIQRIPNAGGEVYYASGASGWNWANRASETYAVFNTTF